MENKLKWQNTKLEPVESFKNGEYEALLEYVKENELALLSTFINEGSSALDLTLKYGCSKMNYLENFLKEENSIYYVLFKLGELKGHLDTLGRIKYEESQCKLAMARFDSYKDDFPNDEHGLAENIIKTLYITPEIDTVGKMIKSFNIKKDLIKATLWHLCRYDFISSYECGERYSLSDWGIYLAKELT